GLELILEYDNFQNTWQAHIIIVQVPSFFLWSTDQIWSTFRLHSTKNYPNAIHHFLGAPQGCQIQVRVVGNMQLLFFLMDWMVNARGMNMSHTNHAIRLELIYKVRGLEAAENYFANLPDPAKNHRTYGSLLSCYCSAKMEEKATNLYRQMDELGIWSSTLPINNLMSLYMKLDQYRKVVSLFEEMKLKNVKPNSLTCCILMTSYAALNKIDDIEELLKEMVEKDVTLGWSAYSTLASIYVNAGQFGKAESALKKLEGLISAHDDRQPFDFLLSLYASLGNLSEVNRVWNVIKSKFSK
ncbi:hypothetical protein ACJX0J_033602, partial [Zea mays]